MCPPNLRDIAPAPDHRLLLSAMVMTQSDVSAFGPLRGVRVLDLSRVLAGPWATQTLADMGAEVIKVERPGVGDDTRHWGPPFTTTPDGGRADAAYFMCTNRGKRSVELDMASPEGADAIRKLARNADVVVENFKVGGLKKYGLDYASLSAINPKLVYCSITGFGQDGPDAHRAGYDYMIQAMGGLMSVTGEPGAAPMRCSWKFAPPMTGRAVCTRPAASRPWGCASATTPRTTTPARMRW